jgi:transposase-like protein
MVLNQGAQHGSQWGPIRSIVEKIGCAAETLRNWVRRSERDVGARPGQTTDERERVKELERRGAWVRWFNTSGCLSRWAMFPPAEFESQYHESLTIPSAKQHSRNRVSDNPGAIQRRDMPLTPDRDDRD